MAGGNASNFYSVEDVAGAYDINADDNPKGNFSTNQSLNRK